MIEVCLKNYPDVYIENSTIHVFKALVNATNGICCFSKFYKITNVFGKNTMHIGVYSKCVFQQMYISLHSKMLLVIPTKSFVVPAN